MRDKTISKLQIDRLKSNNWLKLKRIRHKFIPQSVNIADRSSLSQQKFIIAPLFILLSCLWIIAIKLSLNKQQIAKILPLVIGITIWFLPSPEGINIQAWHLLAIFLATIIGFITKPLPMGAIALMALTMGILTNTLTLEQGLSGFSQPTVWLTVSSFIIARAIIKTHLGTRLAYLFINLVGNNSLRLSYGLLITDLILAPVMPSGNARSGGIIFPIVKSLVMAYGSHPGDRTERRLGAFLMLTAYQGTQITTALFLTAMVANPLMAQLAQEITGIELDWLTWALAAILPGMISLLMMPLIIYWLYPPELKSIPQATQIARKQLQQLGKIKISEWSMLSIFLIMLLLWGWGKSLGIASVTTSLIGIGLLLLSRVLTWKDITQEQKAWDIFIWFSILLMMATFLSQFGFIAWLSNFIGVAVQNLRWQLGFICLSLVYFFSNYFFASKATKASAMYPAFLSIAISLGTPPMYAILVLAFLANLSGCLTHYSTAVAPIYFGAGYVDAAIWCKIGFILGLAYLLIWLIIGGWWWQVLGLI